VIDDSLARKLMRERPTEPDLRAAPVAAPERTPSCPPAVYLSPMVPRAEHEARITELLAVGNLHLDAARDERRQHAGTRFERDVWRERALVLVSCLRRMDPIWESL
jgi:hypothetical protein